MTGPSEASLGQAARRAIRDEVSGRQHQPGEVHKPSEHLPVEQVRQELVPSGVPGQGMAPRSEPPKRKPLSIVVDTTRGSVPDTVPVLTPGLARALARVIHQAAASATSHGSCQGSDLSSKAS